MTFLEAAASEAETIRMYESIFERSLYINSRGYHPLQIDKLYAGAGFW